MNRVAKMACLTAAAALFCGAAPPSSSTIPIDEPHPLPGIRPSPQTIRAWEARKFGMFIHFGLYSVAGGVWNGKKVDNGYSEQIMANAPIPKSQYEQLAKRFDPTKFDPDAIVALAKAAGMKFIVITAKHHDGFNLFETKATSYNSVDGTPFHKDIIKMMADACRRAGLAFGVYYSTIDWHHPGGNTYIEGNSNPITPSQEAFNVEQLKELTTHYGKLSEIWFDMGKPTPAQSAHFASIVHSAQPQIMVSGRVWNHQGDFTVMGDNSLPKSEIEEPWQSPASIFGDTWGYRSWQKRDDLPGKIRENIERLAHVASAGGNYILNIGPEGDGSIVPYEADVLKGIGAWMAVNGQAIYGSHRQPFATLDFGYATVKPGKLFLFVRDIPADGKLHLPNVVGDPFGDARILGADGARASVHVTGSDAWIDTADLPALNSGAVMPVIAVDLKSTLTVRPNAIPANSDGTVRLAAKTASVFQNYNGYGYEEPAKTYKLRWYAAIPNGAYRATVTLAKPAVADATIDLLIDRRQYPLRVEKGSTQFAVTVARDAKSMPFAMQVEVTPKEPFTKADSLPVAVDHVDLAPVRR